MKNHEKSSVNLIISGENLDFDKISSAIPLKQKHNKKGTVLRLSFVVETDNIIFDDFIINNDLSVNDKITRTLDSLLPYKDIIKNLSKQYNIRLRIYIQSIMAQMFFSISSKNIQRISEFNISVETSIFSEGMCELPT